MKGGIAAAAIAAMATGANAINHRHAHELFAAKRGAEVEKTCGCTTIYTTITGEPTRELFLSRQTSIKKIGTLLTQA